MTDTDIRAFKCINRECPNRGIELREELRLEGNWCCVCSDPLKNLGGPLFDSEAPDQSVETCRQMFTDEDEKRFGENVQPTYADGFRHGSKEGTAELSAEELRAQLIGYREIARESEAKANRAEQEKLAVETQRSELLRLLRDFDPMWLAKDTTDLMRPPDDVLATGWRTRLSLTMENFKDVPAPNIIHASAIIHGKGSARG